MNMLAPVMSGASPTLPGTDPPPAESELSSDVATALLVAMLRSRGTQADIAQNDVEIAQERLDVARAKLERALERAREAGESAGFWGGIKAAFSGDAAALAGLVASAAAVVASGGTAAAVAAAVAAGMSVGARIAEEAGLDPTACQVIAVAGAVGGLLAGNPEAAIGTASRVASVARGVQAGSLSLAGAAGVVEGHYRGRELHARAAGERAAFERDGFALDLEEALRRVERAIREAERVRSTLGEVVRSHGELELAVISRIGAT